MNFKPLQFHKILKREQKSIVTEEITHVRNSPDGQSNKKRKETFRIKCVSHVEKLELRFFHQKNSWLQSHIQFYGSLSYEISFKLKKKNRKSLEVSRLR